MSTIVNIQSLSLALNGLVSAAGPFGPIQFPLSLQSLITDALTNGTGARKVNQAYLVQATLAASASIDYDLYAFGGALDAGQNPYTNATVKLLIFQNLGVPGAVVEADYIKLGGKGTTAGWTSYFGTNTDTVKILSGPATAVNPNPSPGTHLIYDAGSTGYVVGASTTNHILTLTAGANTGACLYNLLVIGATA
ncbi:MAG: hypothetical protein JWQ04_2788 [Pedosphaera sp.]|nr:hypothetical protein [Pedosphaera sp.]